MAVIKNNGSHLRSKEDEERLARQKAANPTNVARVKELAKQYSNPHNFSNTVTVTRTERNPKWYSGSQPTARETVARMYEVSGGDKVKFQELEAQFNAERSNRGSVIYNPYAQATNYKAVQGLKELGVQVPDKITGQWLDNMWSQYGQYARETTTGYGPSAPTNSSTVENDIAYWVDTLRGDEENTSLAEMQLQTMASEVKYWADRGYSDSEIVKRIQNDFGGKYNVLNQMDEQRLAGDALRLNRAVDYSGEDTIYGMIWAARNGGGSGNYFADSVKYTMGQGNRYKADPMSEAARDPSNYEGYHPYIMGSTMHSMNQKYGVSSFDQKWLDDNRDKLNDPEFAEDYRKIALTLEKDDERRSELAILDKWIGQQMGKGRTEDELVAMLEAAITDGAEIQYVDEEGETQKVRLTALSAMEKERGFGSAVDTVSAIDFTLPRYIDRIGDVYAEFAPQLEAAEAAVQNTEGEEVTDEEAAVGKAAWDAIDSGLDKAGNGLRGWLSDRGVDIAAAFDGEVGSYGEAQSVFNAQKGADTVEEVFTNYMKDEFGIKFEGALSEAEQKIVQDALDAFEVGSKVGATEEEREAMQKAATSLYMLGEAVVSQSNRHATYKDDAAYSTVIGDAKKKQQEDLYARGMVEGEFVPQAHIRGAEGNSGGLPQAEGTPGEFDSAAYEAMLAGDSTWDGELFAQALQVSTDPNQMMAELRDGIAKQMMGEEGNAISQSWMKKFGGMTRNEEITHSWAPGVATHLKDNDSRRAYGPEIYSAILANEKALEMGAISRDEYIANLVSLSSAAEVVQIAAGGKKVKDKLSAQVLASGDGSMGAGVAAVEARCNELIAGKEQEIAKAQEEERNSIIALRDADYAGEDLDEAQAMQKAIIVGADVSAVANKDKTYRQYSKFLEAAAPGENSYADLQMQAGDPNSPANTIGGYDAVYNRGVSMLAMNTLDRDMQYAAALGMSLEEYYEEFPELSKSPEQIMEEAKAEYDAKWGEYASDPDALQMVNEIIRMGSINASGEEEPAYEIGEFTPIYEDGLTFADIFANATSAWGNRLDMNLAKTKNFFLYDFGNDSEKTSKLITKYGNDPAALKRRWDEVLLDEKVPDSVKAEIQARLDTTTDIYKMGDPDELMGDLDIAEYEKVDKYFQDIIEANGSDFEKFAYNAIISAEDMITMMATGSAAQLFGAGGYAASLASAFTSEYANAYDYTQQTGDAMSAFLWSTATWFVNAKIEQMQLDNYLNPKATSFDDMINHAKYVRSKDGLMKAMTRPDDLKKLVKGALGVIGKAGSNAAGEAIEETSQSLVSAFTENRALAKDEIITAKQAKEALVSGGYGAFLGLFASGMTGDVSDPTIDYMSNEIKAAEEVVDPAYEGTIINEAIEIESTIAAIQTSGEQLTQLQDSAENKALKAAEETVESTEQELASATEEYDAAVDARTSMSYKLAELDQQMRDSAEFSEELGTEIEQVVASIQQKNAEVAKLEGRLTEAQQRRDEAVQQRDAAATVVQSMYRSIMDNAKAEAAQAIADKYYNGSTEAQKTANEKYRAACAKLADANKRLREAQFKNGRNVQRGKALLEIEGLQTEVAEARAEVEAAYAESEKGKLTAEQQAELDKATEAAQKAATEADADVMNAKKQAAADFAQTRLKAVEARQKMDNLRSSVVARLNDTRASVRAEAVAEWQAAQQEANAAAQAAQEAEALYNETDSQRELREAIEEAKKYTSEQLLFEDVEGHAEAVAAYNRLQKARADVNAENALAHMNAQEIGTPEHDEAVAAYNKAVEEQIELETGADAETVRAAIDEMVKPVSQQVLEAVSDKNSDKAERLVKKILESKTESGQQLAALAATEDAEQAAASIVNELMNEGENAEAITSLLNEITDTTWKNRAAAMPGTATANANPIEIMRNITKKLRIGYKPGGTMAQNGKNLPKAVMAAYSAHAGTIDVRTSEAGNLATNLHELGHAVRDRLGDLHATDAMIDALSDGIKQSYGGEDLDSEAISEFVVDYLFSRDSAIENAGADFVQQFETMVKADKRLYNALEEARNDITLWTTATTQSKAKSQIKVQTVYRSQVGNWLQRTLRSVETGLFDRTAPAKLVSREFHQKALYSMHATNRADVVLSQRLIDPITNEEIGKSLAERLYDAGVDEKNMEDVVTYALLRHHLDRSAQNKAVFNEAEFPADRVEATLKDMEKANQNIARQADAITEFWNDFADAWLVNTGLVSPETIQKMREMYPHYVPTFRVIDHKPSNYGGNSSKFKLRSAVKGGSSLEVINPLASMVAQVQKVVRTVSQNQLMQAFDAELKKGDLGMIAKEVDVTKTKQSNDVSRAMAVIEQMKASDGTNPELLDSLIDELGKLEEKFVSTGQAGPGTVSMIDSEGKAHFYEIYDDGLFNVLSSSTQSMRDGLQALRSAKNVITSLTTANNPMFALKNMMRDFQVSVNTGTWALTYADGVVKWVKAFGEVLGQSENFKNWRALGGGEHTRMNAAVADKDVKAAQKQLTQMLLRGKRTASGEFKLSKTALDKISNLVTFKDLNNIIENTSRYVEYAYGKHDLTTPEGQREAFMASQDVTTNFGTHGAWAFINTLSAITPFMNATLQGLNKDIHIVADCFSKDRSVRAAAAPKAAKIVLNTALTAGLQYAILKLFKRGQTDDEEYALLNDAMKAGNLIIPIPDALLGVLQEATGFNKPYFRIPIAQGTLHQGFYATALELFGSAEEGSPFDIQLGSTVLGIVKDAFPTSGSIFQSVLDARRNKTWYGGNIETYKMGTYGSYNRTDEDVPGIITDLARVFGTSPAKVDYVAQQSLGGLYRVAAPLMSSGTWDERLGAAANSIMSYYTVDPVVTNDIQSEFYAARTVLSQTNAEGKDGLPLSHIAYSADPKAALDDAKALAIIFDDAKKAAGAIDSQIDDIMADESMSRGEKARAVRELQKQKLPIFDAALVEFDRYASEYIYCDGWFGDKLGRAKDFFLGNHYNRPVAE